MDSVDGRWISPTTKKPANKGFFSALMKVVHNPQDLLLRHPLTNLGLLIVGCRNRSEIEHGTL